MRVPCAALALDVTDSKSGTIQAEVVSTMAICGSIITNLIATTGAVLVGSAVVAVLPAFLNSALKNYAAAAIFGGTFGNFAVKYPKVACIEAVCTGTCMAGDRMCRIWHSWNGTSVLCK